MATQEAAQSVPERFHRGPVVYFVGAGDGPVKIGFTCELPHRLRSLQNSSPVSLKLLAAVHGGRDREKEYHSKFKADRLHGEWFARSEAIVSELVQIRWVAPVVENVRRFARQNEKRRGSR